VAGVWLWGIPVDREDAKALVATLIADGSPDAVAAAKRIGSRLDQGSDGLVALEPQHRDAIIAVLEDPPDGLNELRGAAKQRVTLSEFLRQAALMVAFRLSEDRHERAPQEAAAVSAPVEPRGPERHTVNTTHRLRTIGPAAPTHGRVSR
jgi:hypothetical protein